MQDRSSFSYLQKTGTRLIIESGFGCIKQFNDGAYKLLCIRSAHLEILGFPMGAAY